MRYEKGTDMKGKEAYIDRFKGKFISKEEYDDATAEDDGYKDLDGEWFRIF